MHRSLRFAPALVLLIAGCHRDLDVDVPSCAREAEGCQPADSAAAEEGTDAELDTASAPDTASDSFVAETATDTAIDTDAAPDTACSGGACAPSCAGGLTCGSGGVSCCESKLVPGGTVPMGRASTGPETDVCSTWADGPGCDAPEQPEHNAKVSSFRLDTFEVTVARFRKFVAGYPGNKPITGAGAHPLIAGSGWKAEWTASLPVSAVDLMTTLKCESTFQTWTDSVGPNENKPINCIDWHIAFAFCAWDGGRLPTEAEWEYAAAGGSENRVVPWGNTGPNKSLASYDCSFSGTRADCDAADLPVVGSTPLGESRWGQQDLAGSVAEWALDLYADYTSAPTTDYANLSSGSVRIYRGGAFNWPPNGLRAVERFPPGPYPAPMHDLGFRCARSP